MEDNTTGVPQPPADRPWEAPFGLAAPPQQGQPPTAMEPFWSSPPPQRPAQTPPAFEPRVATKRIGLTIGVIVIVVVVGVIAVVVVGLLLLGDKVTGAIKSGFGGGPPATVLVDGQPLNIESGTSCRKQSDGNIRIDIDTDQGIWAMIVDSNPPRAKLVGLGKVDGVQFGWIEGPDYPGSVRGKTTVTRDGNTFKISGTASGSLVVEDPLQPQPLMKKQFEITATCPKL